MSFAGMIFFTMAAAFLGLQFKQGKSEYGIYLMVAAGVMLFFSVLSGMKKILDGIDKIEAYIGLDSSYMNFIVKIIGITYVTQFASDICKDCGYQTLANQLLIFGKMSVLIVSMPVVLSLMEVINQILG